MKDKKKLRERTDLIIAAIVILIAGVFILYKVLNKTPKEENVLDQIKNIEEQASNKLIEGKETLKEVNNTIEKDVEPLSDETILESDTIAYNEKIHVNELTDKVNLTNKKEEEVIQDIIEEEIVIEKEYTEDVLETTKYEDKVETVKSTIDEEELALRREVEEDLNNSATNIKETVAVKEEIKSSNNSDCVVVVGAYSELYNKDNTIDKLIKLGYAYAEGELKNGLTYVGVPVDCNDKKGIRKLYEELDNAFNVLPWIKKK